MKFLKNIIKFFSSGILAILLLSLFLCFYSLTPVHIENSNGNTDYVWNPNSVWCRATEGIAYGRFDSNGYNNLEVVDNPEIIVLGSSHAEARNVLQNENFSFLLSQKLNGTYTLYNMGISGHTLTKVSQYLPANMELYDNSPKVTIIETATVNISQDDVNSIISSSVDFTNSYNSGILGFLQRIPFFRAGYQQIERGLLERFMSTDKTEDSNNHEEKSEPSTQSVATFDESPYDEFFSYLSDIEEKYGTQIIIFYHPTEVFMENGDVSFSYDGNLSAFSEYAGLYDISFIDMSDAFLKMFEEQYHVAHGFSTGELGVGHLNKYGHAAVAGELYQEIIRLEECGQLCQ